MLNAIFHSSILRRFQLHPYVQTKFSPFNFYFLNDIPPFYSPIQQTVKTCPSLSPFVFSCSLSFSSSILQLSSTIQAPVQTYLCCCCCCCKVVLKAERTRLRTDQWIAVRVLCGAEDPVFDVLRWTRGMLQLRLHIADNNSCLLLARLSMYLAGKRGLNGWTGTEGIAFDFF